MRYIIYGFFLLAFCTLGHSLYAQLPQGGTIKGKAKDSVYNFMLTGATVAVYKDADSSLLGYTLPDNFGEFVIHRLPVDTTLRLIITHVGYHPFFKKIKIPTQQKGLDMGLLYLYQKDQGKEEDTVLIKVIPPMRMNGDTVEFNADAFRMDANATAEDLMRRIEGFTIWGDGEITFNGKKINTVLVNGKPFMGTGDITVATQNLPKDALEKIQVYQQRNEHNPLDSTLFANLKLKEDKSMGYFGKTGIGYGGAPTGKDMAKTTFRYAADGMLSGFNKKLQISAVAALNNINKLANSTDVLMRNSSFKGEGANIEYQSDFNMKGLNKPVAAGIRFQYDLIPDVSYLKSSRINGNYFIQHNNKFIENNIEANTFLKADTILKKNTNNTNEQIGTSQNVAASWGKDTPKYGLTVRMNMGTATAKANTVSNTIQHKTGIGNISRSMADNSNEQHRTTASFGVEYNNRIPLNIGGQQSRFSKSFRVGYDLNYSNDDKTAQNKTRFTDIINSAANRYFDRLYAQDDNRQISHTFNVNYDELKRLIFHNSGLGGIEMKLATTAIISKNSNDNKVLDKDTLLDVYTVNNGLTYNTTVNTSNIMPVITLSKSFNKGLTNRYSKYVNITADIKGQLYEMHSLSSLPTQNIQYNYQYFIPRLNAVYANHQYGSYEVEYNIGYNTDVIYPSLNNIAPVVDSSNIWMIPKGNRTLKPQFKKDINIAYRYATRTPKNPFIMNAALNAGVIQDMITDSVLYDNAGVRTVYTMNMEGYHYGSGMLSVKKSVELKNKNTFELEAKYNIYKAQNPQYINSVLNTSKSISHNSVLAVSYRYKDLATVKVEENIYVYMSRQTGLNGSKFSSLNQFTRVIGTLQLPKDLVWSTNITLNKSSNNTADAVQFTIWNASLTYRFLKGNRGEVKFSALDLLRQNKGIVNTSEGNTQIFTISNVLQHYYMITLAYYPRKFGKS